MNELLLKKLKDITGLVRRPGNTIVKIKVNEETKEVYDTLYKLLDYQLEFNFKNAKNKSEKHLGLVFDLPSKPATCSSLYTFELIAIEGSLSLRSMDLTREVSQIGNARQVL